MQKIKKNIGVYGPIPSGPNNCIQGNGRPSYKTQKERQYINNILNRLLKKRCQEENILFKNIENISNEYYCDGVHLYKAQNKLVELFSDLK